MNKYANDANSVVTVSEDSDDGVSARVLDELTTVRIIGNSADENAFDQEACCICLSDYDTGDEVRVLACDHSYHTECIDQWLERNNTCPLCSRSITDLPAEAAPEQEMNTFSSYQTVAVMPPDEEPMLQTA